MTAPTGRRQVSDGPGLGWRSPGLGSLYPIALGRAPHTSRSGAYPHETLPGDTSLTVIRHVHSPHSAARCSSAVRSGMFLVKEAARRNSPAASP